MLRFGRAAKPSLRPMPAPELPVEGRPDAVVRVVAYEDLQCPDSSAYRRMLDGRLLERFGERAAFLSRDFPLEKHRWAEPAAVASRFFAARGGESAVAFRRYCLENNRRISAESFPELLADFAARRGYDPEEAIESLRNPAWIEAVRAEKAQGKAHGVEKTPTVFLGERSFVEVFTVEEIEAAIEEALEKDTGR